MKESIKILLVEDNPGDARLFTECLKGANIENETDWVKGGEEALDYLFKRGKYTSQSHPDLIFLDLNLLGIHGFDVLKKIKQEEALKNIAAVVVVVLSSSDQDSDIKMVKRLKGDGYLTKPIEPEKFLSMILKLKQFSLGVFKEAA